MELLLDTHYKYDTFGRYYYLTPVGAELITGLNDLDNEWNNVERRLKSQGKLLKTIMSYSINNEFNEYSRQDIIEYKQYKNAYGEQDAILYMLGEMAEWAYEIDGDLIAYEERNPFDVIKLLPLTIQQKGKKTGLIFVGKVSDTIPEDEYQVGY